MPEAKTIPEIRAITGLSEKRFRALQESFKACDRIDKTVNLTTDASRD